MPPSKKYERYFKPVSRNGFSSSGTYRGKGRIGQTSLLSTGNSSCASTESNGVKPDSCRKCRPHVVQETTPMTQSELLTKKLTKQLGNCNESGKNAGKWDCKGNCDAASYHIGGKKYIFEPYAKNVDILTASEYMKIKLGPC